MVSGRQPAYPETRMKALALALCAVAALPAAAKIKTENTTAEHPESCPVLIESFGRLPSTQPVLGNMELRYLNQSGKTIIGINFGLELMDAVGDFRPAIGSIDYAGKTDPGKSAHVTGRSLGYDGISRLPGERLHIIKVAFSDGTTWEDDGTGKCFVSYEYRKT